MPVRAFAFVWVKGIALVHPNCRPRAYGLGELRYNPKFGSAAVASPLTFLSNRPRVLSRFRFLNDRNHPVSPTQSVKTTKLRIISLVVTYVALGCATRWFVNLTAGRYGYYHGWMFVQAVVCALLMLLGLWLVLQRRGIFWRILGCLAGIIFSAALLSNGYPTSFRRLTILISIFFPLCAIATHGLIRCYWKAEPTNIHEVQEGRRDAFQFSIRHLIGLNVFVGCLLAFANALRTQHFGGVPFFQWGSLSIEYMSMLTAFVMSFTLVVIAISTIWATLGMATPMPRLILVFTMAPLLGLLYPYVSREALNQFPLWVAAHLLTTALVTGALLVVRSCGTRLVRRS